MLLTRQCRQQVVDRFTSCLARDGWLVVTPAEAVCVEHADLASADVPRVAWFNNKGAVPSSAEAVFPSWSHPVFQPPDASAPSANPPLPSFIPDVTAGAHPATPPDDEPQPDDSLEIPKDHLFIGFGLYSKENMPRLSKSLLRPSGTTGYMRGNRWRQCVLWLEATQIWGASTKRSNGPSVQLAMDKLNPEFHYLHGVIFQEKGDVESAKRAFGKAIFLEPDFVLAHVSLSSLARVQKRLEEAKRHTRTALMILDSRNDEDTLVASEGMTVRRLKEVLRPVAGVKV